MSTKLRSLIEQEVLADRPALYYTLGDPSESTSAADSSGNAGAPLPQAGDGVDDVVFGNGTGPSSDGLTAAQTVAGGKYLKLDGFGPYTASSGVAIEAWVNTTAPDAMLLAFGDPSASLTSLLAALRLFSGSLVWTAGGSDHVIASPVVNDGRTHHVAVTLTPTVPVVASVYVDGALIASQTVATGSAGGNSLMVGGWPGVSPLAPVDATFSHVALFLGAVPSAARMAARGVAAGSETTAQRLTRLAGYGAVPAGEISASGSIVIGAQATSGKTISDALRDVEASEAGILFDGRAGTLTLQSRSFRYAPAVGLTLSVAAGQVGADYSPAFDGTQLVNDATVTGPSGSARYTDRGSIDEHGVADYTGETLATNPDEPLEVAGWQVNISSQPRGRVPNLTVDVLTCGIAQNTVAAVDVSTLVQVTNLPGQAAAASASYFVEGYTESFGPESWQLTFNVSDATPYLSTWVLDSGTRSQLDSTTVLAL